MGTIAAEALLEDGDNIDDTKKTILYSRKDGSHDVSQFVFQDYKIIRTIGRGTFGKILLVQNQKTERKFAMKSIRKDVVIDY